MALREFQHDSSLLTQVSNGGIGVVSTVVAEHLAELGVCLKLLEAVIGNGEPVWAVYAVIKLVEIDGE